jgi:uncharacterized protein (TIGR03435 family)
MDEMTDDDLNLLQEYARNDSEEAFSTLVDRHVNLVYSVALRQLGDPHLAEEITQATFIILARKAGSLSPGTIVSGWLCRTARYTSSRALTMQRRRQRREQEAHMQSVLNESEKEVWPEIAPLLDDAMERLGRTDHDAIVLRFFEGRNFREVGMALGTSEDAAKTRVHRALEKLRKYFTKRGVNSTTAIVAGTISAHSVQAAPVALTKIATAAAIAKGATASGPTLILIQGALKVMAWTKAKTTIAVAVGILLAAGTATITVKEIQAHKTYPWQVPKADFGVFYNMPAAVKIVPTKFAENGGSCGDGGRGAMGIAQPLETIIQAAYQKDNLRTAVKTDLPKEKYDFIAKLVGPRQPHKNLPNNVNWTIALQKEITRKFGITGSLQMIETDVLALRPCATGTRGFKVSHSMPHGTAISENKGTYSFYEQPASTLIGVLERHFKIPIVDQTGLSQSYDYTVKYDEPDPQQPNLEGLKDALQEQLGLELVRTNMPIEMLVIEKAK